MRWSSPNGVLLAVAVGWLTIASSCRQTPPCAAGTIFLNIDLTDDAAQNAVSFDVIVTIDNGTPQNVGILPRSRPIADPHKESVAIALGDHYASVRNVQLDVIAYDFLRRDLASGSITSSLRKTCSVLTVHLSDSGPSNVDAGAGDGAVAGSDGVADPGVQLLISESFLTVNEGDASGGTFTVGLSRPLSEPLVVTILDDNPTVATTSIQSLTFAANEIGPRRVTVIGQRDDDFLDGHATLWLSTPGVTPASVQVKIIDTDVQAVLVLPQRLSVIRGRANSLSIRLAYRPPASAIVTISSAKGAIAVNPSTLTFKPDDYDIPQQVTLTAQAPGDDIDNQVNVSISATDAPTTVIVPVSIADSDIANLLVRPSVVMLTEGDPQPISAFVSLTVLPANTVTVTAISSDPTKATVFPSALTITPADFRTEQLIQISAVSDDDTADEVVSVTLAAPGLEPRSISVSIKDDDQQAIQLVYPGSPDPLTLQESRADATPNQASLGVRLAFRPKAPWTVSVVSSDPRRLVSVASALIFAPDNFGVTQMLGLITPHDQDVLDNMANLTFVAPGIPTVNLPVQILDIDGRK